MKKTINWIISNINTNEGIVISDKQKENYPEVSGYLLITLLNLGYKDKAEVIADWLASIQNTDGSFGIGGDTYTFDTSMILWGLQSFENKYSDVKEKACKFLASQIEQSGKISSRYHMNGVSEKILVAVAMVLEKAGYNVQSTWAYYFRQQDFLELDCLSHFHCYVLQFCLESKYVQQHFGYIVPAKEAIANLSKLQKKDGSLAAYPNVDWICYTGVAQFAILCFKVGLIDEGNKVMKYLESIISPDGGILGCSQGGDYFPDAHISWAAKFYVDAYQLMIEKHMDKMINEFPNRIDVNDVRTQFLIECIPTHYKNLLDIGCGKGKYWEHIKGSGFIYGIDIADELIKYTKDKFDGYFHTVKKGSALNIPYADELFDYVYCVEVLEHIPYLVENAIREVLRVMKPDGRYIIIDKNKDFVGNKLAWEDWFDMQTMTDLLLKYFKEVKVKKLDEQFIGFLCDCKKI